mgnify:CR=1 FL=1
MERDAEPIRATDLMLGVARQLQPVARFTDLRIGSEAWGDRRWCESQGLLCATHRDVCLNQMRNVAQARSDACSSSSLDLILLQEPADLPDIPLQVCIDAAYHNHI